MNLITLAIVFCGLSPFMLQKTNRPPDRVEIMLGLAWAISGAIAFFGAIVQVYIVFFF